MTSQVPSFSERARTELNARKGEWPTLCERTGLSYWWVTKFGQGRIAEAGVSKIEKLHAYFAEHPRSQVGDTGVSVRPAQPYVLGGSV